MIFREKQMSVTPTHFHPSNTSPVNLSPARIIIPKHWYADVVYRLQYNQENLKSFLGLEMDARSPQTCLSHL